MGAPQGYIQQPMPQPMQPTPVAFGKKVIFVLLLVGAILVVVGHLLAQLTSEVEYDRVGNALARMGGLVGFATAVGGALGSSRVNDLQRVGLLVVAAAFAFAQI